MMSQVWSNSLIEMWNSISSRTATSLKRQTSLSSTDAVALGKSELVRQSIADRDDAVYYQAVESTAPNQLEQFIDTASAQFPSLRNVRRDWEVLLEALGEENAVVIIDEFPFLIEEDDSLPSRLQRVWDMELQDTEMTLILVGSSISVMEDKVLSGSAPLYGRRTATIDLKPLDVSDAHEFFPEYDAETAITAWAIYGARRTISKRSILTSHWERMSKRRFCQSAASCTPNRSSYSVPNSDNRTRISVSFAHSLTGVERQTRLQAWLAWIRDR